jgi:hypothetical protein
VISEVNATTNGPLSEKLSDSDVGGASVTNNSSIVVPSAVPTPASIVPETDAPATSESDSDETPSADFDDFSQLDDEDEFDGELSDEEQDENKEPAATESTKDLAFTPSSINANSKTQTDLSATQQEKEPSSLQGFGFIVLGSGGLVIVATLAFLYKRVFRSKRQQYMNINNQRLPTTV